MNFLLDIPNYANIQFQQNLQKTKTVGVLMLYHKRLQLGGDARIEDLGGHHGYISQAFKMQTGLQLPENVHVACVDIPNDQTVRIPALQAISRQNEPVIICGDFNTQLTPLPAGFKSVNTMDYATVIELQQRNGKRVTVVKQEDYILYTKQLSAHNYTVNQKTKGQQLITSEFPGPNQENQHAIVAATLKLKTEQEQELEQGEEQLGIELAKGLSMM